MSADAVRLLQEQGYTALQLREGVAEWAYMDASRIASKICVVL